MNKKKATLFGGALLCAGLASTASAQTLSILDTGSYSGTVFNTVASLDAGFYTAVPYAYGLDTNTTEVWADGDDLNATAVSIAGGTTVNSTLTDTLIRYDATWDGTSGDGSFFGGFVQVFFTLDQATDIELTWDMSNTDFFGPPNFFTIFSGGAIIPDGTIDITPTNPTGSALVSLDADTEYGIVLGAGNPFGFDTDVKFLQAEVVPIPEPTSVALLGMAAAGLVRRRRA